MHLVEKIEESINEGNKNSHLDFALHASLQDVESQMLHIKEAMSRGVTSFKSGGRYLSVVVSLCGTEEDPQNLEEQKRKLLGAGVIVLPTNALATRVAA